MWLLPIWSHLELLKFFNHFTIHIFGIIYLHVNISLYILWGSGKNELVIRWAMYLSNTNVSLKALNGADLINGSWKHTHNVFLKIILMCACTAWPLPSHFPSLISLLQLLHAHLRTNTICIQSRTLYKLNGVILGESLKTQYKTFPHSPEMHF